ncbi:MAG: glycosyltransferase [Spirochaetaceae bacterium]|nr:glycosyltransferase [Spirochaetaceae bacterium]
MQPKVSVIIPVYNTAPYLRRCLDSVCNQTLRDIEIVCVNDGSTDNSLDILNEYAARDRRSKVIDFPENKGVSAARNAGIDAAEGECIGFVDSDDAVEPDFYAGLYRQAIKTGAEIVKGEVRVAGYDGIARNLHISRETRLSRVRFSGFSTAIYKNELVKNNKIIFPAGIVCGEDLVFSLCTALKAKETETVDGIFYIQYRRKDSANSETYDMQKINSIIESYYIMMREINLDRDKINDAEYNDFLFSAVHAVFELPRKNDSAECGRLCAKTCIELYRKYLRGNYHNEILQAQIPFCFCFEYLDGDDLEGLTDYLLKGKFQADQTMALLRRRVKISSGLL